MRQERDGYCNGTGACWSAGSVGAGVLRKANAHIRSRREVVTFNHPFRIRGIDRLLLAGDYEIVTDEELIEFLSAAFRRIAIMIKVPAEGSSGLPMEVVSIGPGRSCRRAAHRRSHIR